MVPRVRICGFCPKKNDRIDENFFLGGLERWSSVSQVNGILYDKYRWLVDFYLFCYFFVCLLVLIHCSSLARMQMY